jgi:CRP-like cAMP-binding protein
MSSPSVHYGFPAGGIFEHLSEDVLRQLTQHGQLITAPPHTSLNRVGDPCDGLSVILSGQVRVEQMDALGWEPIATMSAGDLMGARAWASRSIWRERITAIDEVRLLFMPHGKLRALLSAYPDLQRQLERYAERHTLHGLLGAHPIFQGVMHQDLMRLVDLASLRHLQAGATLFSPHLILALLFVIGHGEVELSVNDEPLLKLGRGEVLNLEFILSDTLPLTTACALQPTTLYTLPFDEVELVLKRVGLETRLIEQARFLRSRIFKD